MELPYNASKQPIVDFIPFDGLKFKTVFWQAPESVPYKGRILWVHGFAESSTIYTEFFDKLSDLGFDIFFFDQRGAGETSPDEDHGKTNEQLVYKDLDFMIKKNLEISKRGDKSLILMGHLMGGGIALNYGIKGTYKEVISSIIVSGPEVLLHPNTAPNFILKGFAGFAAKHLPNFRINAGLNYDYITSNEKYRDYIKSNVDKFWITGPLFHGMLTRGEALTKPEYTAKFDPNISVMVCHGTEDKINWLDGSKKFYDLLNDNVDKEFVPIEGARHNLASEKEEYIKQFLDKIVEFVDKHQH